jgi:hypothetical protein
MIRTDEEYIFIRLDQPYGIIRSGCENDALEVTNGVLKVSHVIYNVSFQTDVVEGYDNKDWIIIEPREDKLNAEEILGKIRNSDGPRSMSLVDQLKRHTSMEDKLKGDLEDSFEDEGMEQYARMKDFLTKE